MGFFNMFAVALSVLFFGSAQAAPFIPSGAMPNTLIEPVQWHRYRYYGGGGGYPDNGYIPGYGAVCSSPYVSVGDRCVYGGYAGGYRGAGRYRGNGYIPGYGTVCSFPYVSVGDRCMRAR
jgi:hypothetical protein